MSFELEVRYGEQRVGALRVDALNHFCFRYLDEWLRADDAFPVSVTLPLSSTETMGGSAHAFFSNLLPEGNVRQEVCSRLGISVSNDVELLRALGGECAGALWIAETGVPLELPENEYAELLPKQILQLTEGHDRIVPLLIGGAKTRLSLAGAQDKLPVAVFDGKIHWPRNGSPSTHILKLPNPRYPYLPENEAFLLGLARRAGLECPGFELVSLAKQRGLLVERYDRLRTDDPWPARRLHQEDFCQGLGLLSSQKYEQEGGPTFAQAVELVRTTAVAPLKDVQRLVEWQTFNAAAGNADGHGKNLSILYDKGGPRLAPFYDLVATREYRNLIRLLAMGIGGQRDADVLGREHWRTLAREIEVRDRAILELVGGALERLAEGLPGWTSEYRERYGEVPVLQTLPKRISKQVRRLQRALAPERKPT